MSIQAWLQYEGFRADHALYLKITGPDGRTSALTGFSVTPIADGPLLPEPIRREELAGHSVGEFLQAIVDAAWVAGIRPRGVQEANAETAAVKRHLEDMRAIAFAKSDVAKP